MNLHRVNGKPDWRQIAKHRYNRWQRTAVRTNGIITPGNAVTTIGILMVFGGLYFLGQHQFLLGTLLVGVGRLLDIVDGIVADKTGTKSPYGELYDVICDKVGTLATILVLYISTIAPWGALTLLLLPHAAIILVSFIQSRRKIILHPAKTGKLSMLIGWVSLVGFLTVQIFNGLDFALYINSLYALAVVSLLLGAHAVYEYARTK